MQFQQIGWGALQDVAERGQQVMTFLMWHRPPAGCTSAAPSPGQTLHTPVVSTLKSAAGVPVVAIAPQSAPGELAWFTPDGSGHYRGMSRYDLSRNTVADLLADEDVVAIVERHRPSMSTSKDVASVANLPVDQALHLAQRYASAGEIEEARAELEAL